MNGWRWWTPRGLAATPFIVAATVCHEIAWRISGEMYQ